MAFPRTRAVITVTLLIGVLAAAAVVGVNWIGPTLAHGTNVLHKDGIIVKLAADRSFVLKTDTGEQIPFRCPQQCRASTGHLQRHLIEKAHTDVYYIVEAGNIRLAVDVD